MVIEIVGGLTSRLDVLCSILLSKHSSQIKLVWWPSIGINARFQDLFINKFDFVEFKDIELEKFQIKQYVPGSHVDPRLETNTYLLADYPILFEDTYKKEMFNCGDRLHPCNFYMRELRPIFEIEDVVQRYSDIAAKCIGINIRRGSGLNYHPNSCIYSPSELFYEKISSTNDPIFISTDSYYEVDRLNILFPGRIHYVKEYLKYPLDDGYTLAGVKRSLIDWYLLGQTKKIYTSYRAGYALRASRLNNIEIEELVSAENAIDRYFSQSIENKQKGLF